jgi:hypothetical protein
MLQLVVQYKWSLIGVLLGAIGGYLYWFHIGCLSGTCPLKSQWPYTTAYGGLLGYTVLSFIDQRKKKNEKETAE